MLKQHKTLNSINIGVLGMAGRQVGKLPYVTCFKKRRL